MSADDVPRHLRVAIANATRAFQRRDPAALATINEDIQPLVDAAMAWVLAERARADTAGDAARAAVVAYLRSEAERCARALEERNSHGAGIAMVALRARADAVERGDDRTPREQEEDCDETE